MHPNLAGVSTGCPSTDHVIGHMSAVDLWLGALLMGDDPHFSLLQIGVLVCLCDTRHIVQYRQINTHIRKNVGQLEGWICFEALIKNWPCRSTAVLKIT